MKIEFSEYELLKKGFEKVCEGSEIYFQYVFKPEDYFNSNFLATESIPEEEYILDLGNKLNYVVISPYAYEGQPHRGLTPVLGEEDLDIIIKRGEF